MRVPKVKHHVLQHVYSSSGPFTLSEGSSMRLALVTTFHDTVSFCFKSGLKYPTDLALLVKC
ncbi:hypothetical protein E6H30_03865 [Candidatus Bathyarchaeota archaeon]|nr:MAG: hypothetical protein E6H30_03865 [Candidatus Bathyarchaeota archaeon]